MSSSPLPGLSVEDLLGRVKVAADRHSARVGSRVVRADTLRELQQRLSAALYETLHVGRDEEARSEFRLRDPAMERDLTRVVPHGPILRPATVLSLRADRSPNGPEVLTSLDGVRVWVPSRRFQEGGVLTSPVRPALSPGFCYVMGSREPRPGDAILRVYVHLTNAAHAVGVWAAALDSLERSRACYHAKVLSMPGGYPRRDALVVYLGRESWSACHDLADTVGALSGIGTDTSSFAHRIGRGVAVAWEPDDPRPGVSGVSFGQHRAAVLAEAALAGPSGDTADVFRASGIDPSAPFRNLGSPPLPEREGRRP